MKIALITDTHFGARKANTVFHDYFKKFYEELATLKPDMNMLRNIQSEPLKWTPH